MPRVEHEQPELDWGKLKALVHYVCHKAPNPKKLGATRLNKILFYSDLEAYLSLGAPITGETYVKEKYGPVPQHILKALEELEQDKAIAIAEASGYLVYTGRPYQQRQFFSLRKPILDLFTAEEVSIVDELINLVCTRHTATSISNLSHDVVYEAAEMGEPIPYFTAFAHLLHPPSAASLQWAKDEIARRH